MTNYRRIEAVGFGIILGASVWRLWWFDPLAPLLGVIFLLVGAGVSVSLIITAIESDDQ